MNDLADENTDHYIFPLEDVKCFVTIFFVTAQLILKTQLRPSFVTCVNIIMKVRKNILLL